MQQLESFIEGALKGQNNILRAQSQGALIQLREGNPCEFLMACSAIMNNESKSSFMRQSTGAVLGRSAITKNINGIFYWDFLSNEMKNQIRDNVINTLISNDPLIVNSGASTISQIASLQISRGNWLDLIDIFAENVQHDNFSVRRASIISIGYICQQLNSINANVNPRSCQQLLASIIVGSREKSSPQILEAAYKALRNSISFLTPILQSQQVRNETFKIIIQNIGNKEYSRVLYESLFQFSKQCYEFLGEYLSQIISISEMHLALRNQITILALELWDVIGEEYNQRVKQSKIRVQQQNNNYNINIPNYLEAVKGKLLDLIIKCVIIYNNNDLQMIELRQSGVKTLGTFVEACDRNTVDQITQFVSELIGSQNVGERQASTLIFSALCESHDPQYVKNSFANGFDFLFQLLSDGDKIVVYSTLLGFKRLLEIFPQVVTHNTNHKVIMEKMLSLIQTSDKQICLESLSILCYITDGLSRARDAPMATDLEYVFKAIVSFYQRNLVNFHNQFKEANEKIIIIILSLVMTTNRKDILLQLIQFALTKFYSMLDTNINDSEILLNGIISIIHTSILALRNDLSDIKLMNQICQLTNTHLQKFGINQQSIALISALAIAFNRRFQPKLPQYWGYVMRAIQMTDNLIIFKTALSTAGDIARCFETDFYTNGKKVLEILFVYIRNNIGLEQKIAILTCMGDLILALKQYASEIIQTALKITNECFQAVYSMQSDPNTAQMAEELKEAIIEMYACLVFAVNNQNSVNRELVAHYQCLGLFVIKTCDPILNPTVSYLKSCLFLIFDCACFYGRMNENKVKVFEVSQSVEIKRLVDIIAEVKNKSDVSELLNLINSSVYKNSLRNVI